VRMALTALETKRGRCAISVMIWKSEPKFAKSKSKRFVPSEVRVQQLQRERDARVFDLKGARAMLERLMQFENNLTGNVLAQEPSLAERIKAVNAN
jgi:hypothetical protein